MILYNNVNHGPLRSIDYNLYQSNTKAPAQQLKPAGNFVDQIQSLNHTYQIPKATFTCEGVIFSDQDEAIRAKMIGCFYLNVKNAFSSQLDERVKAESKKKTHDDFLYQVGLKCLENCLESISTPRSSWFQALLGDGPEISQTNVACADAGFISLMRKIPDGFEILVDKQWVPLESKSTSVFVSFGKGLEIFGSKVDGNHFNSLIYRVKQKTILPTLIISPLFSFNERVKRTQKLHPISNVTISNQYRPFYSNRLFPIIETSNK